MQVYWTSASQKRVQKVLSVSQHKQFLSMVKQLEEDSLVGKHLRLSLWELRIQGKRVYYVVLDECALIVDASKKNEQDDCIKALIGRIDELERFLRELSSRD